MKKLFTILSILLLCLAIGCTEPYDDSEITGKYDDVQEEVDDVQEEVDNLKDEIEDLHTLIDISFEESDMVVMHPNSTREIGYTITSVIDQVTIDVISSADIKASVIANDETNKMGKIKITTGATIDEYSKIIVFVSNGEKVVMKSISFESFGLSVESEDVLLSAPANGGNISLKFLANIDCEVLIPEEAQSWISLAPSTRTMTERNIILHLSANDSYHRSAIVTIQSTDGELSVDFTIKQEGVLGTYIDPSQIPDNEIWYTSIDGEIIPFDYRNIDMLGEVISNTNAQLISNTYSNGIGVLTFDSTLTRVDHLFEYRCEKLQTIYFPDTIIDLNYICYDELFGLASNLVHCHIPNCVKKMGLIITGSSKLKDFTIPNSLCEVSCAPFADCPNVDIILGEHYGITDDRKAFIMDNTLLAVAQKDLTSYTIKEGIQAIGRSVFRGSLIKSVQFPQSLETIGNGAFSFSRIESISLPSNVKYVGDLAFQSCGRLSSIHISETAHDISFGWAAFHGADKVLSISGKYATKDNLMLILPGAPYGKLICIAKKGLQNVSTLEIPANIQGIEVNMLYGLNQLETIIINEGVQYIDNSAISHCANLKTIHIPASVNYVVADGFLTDCPQLQSVYLKATTPPAYFVLQEPAEYDTDFTIYIPMGSLKAYQESTWEPLVKYMKEYNYSDLPHHSSDYSQDGVVTTLQTATKGNGIDIVLMGDAYSDRQIADGTYRTDMETLYNNFFTEEPYKSFQEFFNVYYVNVVSETEGYWYSEPTLGTYFGEGTYVGGNSEAVFNYAKKAIGEDRMNEALIVVAMNFDNYAGTCWMYYSHRKSDYGSGTSISYFPRGGDAETFAALLHHEAGGHGFAKLADEYAYEEYGAITDLSIAEIQEQNSSWGWWKNVDFTNDPNDVHWKHFLADERYANEDLGIFEGGLTYWSGVWRSSENSIMRYNTGGFNAPSREAIYYRIHKLAYGNSWEYNYEEFVKWDAKNRTTTASAPLKTARIPMRQMEHTAPPVVVKKTWKDAIK